MGASGFEDFERATGVDFEVEARFLHAARDGGERGLVEDDFGTGDGIVEFGLIEYGAVDEAEGRSGGCWKV